MSRAEFGSMLAQELITNLAQSHLSVTCAFRLMQVTQGALVKPLSIKEGRLPGYCFQWESSLLADTVMQINTV